MKSQFGVIFWLHLFITILAWFAPFLFWYPLPIAAYTIVMLQFFVFGRCLMNNEHALDDGGDTTFYSYLLELIGFKPHRARLKFFIRRVLYPVLALTTIIWQVVLNNKALIF
jgi:hypothetical protein